MKNSLKTNLISKLKLINVFLIIFGFNLIDIDINTFNIDHNYYEDYINKRKKQKLKMPKLVIPVSLGGISPNMKKIYEISKKNNIKVRKRLDL